MSPRTKKGFRDPDVAALEAEAGGLIDARTLIVNAARKLNLLYRQWECGSSTPLERLSQLASLRGYKVAPMQPSHDNTRDAVVLMSDGRTTKGGQIFYNASRPSGRVAFSVAHEIAHTFFPATAGGARFRELLPDETSETSELEMLCHVGAAELLMPIEEFRDKAGDSWSLQSVNNLASEFGASQEATVFRLATANPRRAVAGSLRFRRTKDGEEKYRALTFGAQRSIFGLDLQMKPVIIETPKYRRQSFHMSESYPNRMIIPWNKSFDVSSCVYGTEEGQVSIAFEALPIRFPVSGRLEAMDAPYQRPDSDPDHPDVLFFWEEAA